MPFTAGHCGRKNAGVSVVGGSKKVERWTLGERGVATCMSQVSCNWMALPSLNQ